jgi:hypothetical protein
MDKNLFIRTALSSVPRHKRRHHILQGGLMVSDFAGSGGKSPPVRRTRWLALERNRTKLVVWPAHLSGERGNLGCSAKESPGCLFVAYNLFLLLERIR